MNLLVTPIVPVSFIILVNYESINPIILKLIKNCLLKGMDYLPLSVGKQISLEGVSDDTPHLLLNQEVTSQANQIKHRIEKQLEYSIDFASQSNKTVSHSDR